ncbi:MAG: hypothetical protein ACR2H2_10600 [Solirubrobacteraceae bacterium]
MAHDRRRPSRPASSSAHPRPGLRSSRRGLILGHFAAERWQLVGAKEGAYVHEVLIGGEGLQRGPRDVLATLLHEGAHAIAAVRGIEDTSRQGRYHNARYKRIAEQVGLDVERDTTIGWSLTALPHATATTYAATIEDLQRAITLHRRSESSSPGATGNANLIAAVCDCPRRIRVAPGTLQKGP